MKQYTITVKMLVDNTNRNAPSLNDLKLAVEEDINTHDNQSYGIVDIRIEAKEEDYCAQHAILSERCRFLHEAAEK